MAPVRPGQTDHHPAPTLIGRSSSHFTRTARIFAVELGVEHAFEVVRDLMSIDPAAYGGNPALKLPNLRTHRGVWFGALNICRELHRLSGRGARVVWPEDLEDPLLANAQELVLHAMATEVNLIMARSAGEAEGGAHRAKMTMSLGNVMTWLESHAAQALALLPPERELSYLEVTLFCLVTHLDFRNVLPTAPYAELNEFCRQFGTRASARQTTYRFDA